MSNSNETAESEVPRGEGVPRNKGRFANGNPGGPGRPRSSAGRSAVALDAIGAEASAAITKVLVEKALAGDLRAAEMILSRVWPQRSGRPIEMTVPPISGLQDYIPAATAVANAVMDGEITPAEGRDISSVLGKQIMAIDAGDIERQIKELQEQQKIEPQKGRWW